MFFKATIFVSKEGIRIRERLKDWNENPVSKKDFNQRVFRLSAIEGKGKTCTAQVLRRERPKETKKGHKECNRIATMNEEQKKEKQNVGGIIEGLYGQRVPSRTAQSMEWLVRERNSKLFHSGASITRNSRIEWSIHSGHCGDQFEAIQVGSCDS